MEAGASFLITLARVLAPRAVRARVQASACSLARVLARQARGSDGRCAFLTTLAAVSFANDEIVDSRHYRPSTRFMLLLLFFVAYETLFETVRYLSVRSFALVSRIYCSIFVSKIEDIIVDFILVCTIPPLESVIVMI